MYIPSISRFQSQWVWGRELQDIVTESTEREHAERIVSTIESSFELLYNFLSIIETKQQLQTENP